MNERAFEEELCKSFFKNLIPHLTIVKDICMRAYACIFITITTFDRSSISEIEQKS